MQHNLFPQFQIIYSFKKVQEIDLRKNILFRMKRKWTWHLVLKHLQLTQSRIYWQPQQPCLRWFWIFPHYHLFFKLVSFKSRCGLLLRHLVNNGVTARGESCFPNIVCAGNALLSFYYGKIMLDWALMTAGLIACICYSCYIFIYIQYCPRESIITTQTMLIGLWLLLFRIVFRNKQWPDLDRRSLGALF